MEAVRDNELCLLQALIVTSDIEKLNNLHETALFVAVCHENTEAVRILLEAGANPEPIPSDFSGWTPLTFASAFYCKDILLLLLKHGANPNTPDGRDFTPIFWGKRIREKSGSSEVFDILIKYGALQDAL